MAPKQIKSHARLTSDEGWDHAHLALLRARRQKQEANKVLFEEIQELEQELDIKRRAVERNGEAFFDIDRLIDKSDFTPAPGYDKYGFAL